jgi:DNA-binding response OmpR family regulator
MQNKVILIADDEVHIRRSLEFVLKREGYQTVLAENGEAALAKAKEIRPDICFLDLQMPPMNGDEVCAAIRKDPTLAQTHVVILTARGQETDKQKIQESGVNEYMTKPFSPSKVVAHVKAVFEARAAHPPGSDSSGEGRAS